MGNQVIASVCSFSSLDVDSLNRHEQKHLNVTRIWSR